MKENNNNWVDLKKILEQMLLQISSGNNVQKI